MRHLTSSVHTRISTACHRQFDRETQNQTQCILKLPLDSAQLFPVIRLLSCPTVEVGAVIRDIKPQAHHLFRIVRTVIYNAEITFSCAHAPTINGGTRCV